jgi:hypothetical protein
VDGDDDAVVGVVVEQEDGALAAGDDLGGRDVGATATEVRVSAASPPAALTRCAYRVIERMVARLRWSWRKAMGNRKSAIGA